MKNISMRTLALVVCSVIAGFGLAATVGTTNAQPTSGSSVCVEIDGINNLRHLNETIRQQESMGYVLTTFRDSVTPCFRHR